MYDKYRIAKKWVGDVQNHANWAKETFEKVILIPCIILSEAKEFNPLCSVAACCHVQSALGREQAPMLHSSVALLPQNDNYPDSFGGLVANELKILYFAKLPRRQIPTALIGGYLH
jgi:hypothetical protein